MSRKLTIKAKVLFIILLLVLLVLLVPKSATADPDLYVPYQSHWTYEQNMVHKMAEEARYIGLPEDNPIIRECSRLWFEYNKEKSDTVDYTQEAYMIARVLYNESRGLSDEENKLVVWCILNRVDAGYGSISEVVTAPYQFAYSEDAPITDRLLSIAKSVLSDYYRGESALILPPYSYTSDYIYFYGDGYHNYFSSIY